MKIITIIYVYTYIYIYTYLFLIFQDRTLSVTWCNNTQLNNQLSGRSSSHTVLVNESEEDHLIDQSLLEGEDEVLYLI